MTPKPPRGAAVQTLLRTRSLREAESGMRDFRASSACKAMWANLVNKSRMRGRQIKVRHGAIGCYPRSSAPARQGMKDVQAVERLCVLGYGEDAAVLLRSNVNLLVESRLHR